MLLHDLRRYRQAEAGAAELLGREERLENVAQRLLGHPDAAIGDRKVHGIDGTVMGVAHRVGDGANLQPAAVRHSVVGVDDQVRKDLAKLMGVGEHRQGRVGFDAHRHRRTGKLLQLRLKSLQPFGDVHGHARRFGDSREAEDLLGDPLAARHGVGDARGGQLHGRVRAGFPG